MIRQALSAAAGHAAGLLKDVLQGRKFAVGPPTSGYTHTLFGNTSVHLNQLGLAAQWHGHEDSFSVAVSAGPVDAHITLTGVDAEFLELEPLMPERVWLLQAPDGGQSSVHLAVWPNRVGFLLEWLPRRRFFRVSAGPLVAVFMDLGAK